MVIEYRTRELNMEPFPEGAGVLPLGHRGFKILVPACTTHEGVSLCADFEEAVLSPPLWRVGGSTIASGAPFALKFK